MLTIGSGVFVFSFPVTLKKPASFFTTRGESFPLGFLSEVSGLFPSQESLLFSYISVVILE